MNKNKLLSVALVVIVYLIFAGTSYMLFSVGSATSGVKVLTPTVGTSGNLAFDNTLPKTEPCPMNGTLYSKQQKIGGNSIGLWG
jgi:hypothetical protein